MSWTNDDGLLIRFGTERGTVATDGQTAGKSHMQQLKVYLDSQDMVAATDANGDRPHLPANAVITGAFVVCETAFTGTGTLSIGLADAAGSAIDADGIDATIDVDSVLAAAGDVVACDGVLVDKTEIATTERAYVYGTVNGTVSAGNAWLYVDYYVAN